MAASVAHISQADNGCGFEVLAALAEALRAFPKTSERPLIAMIDTGVLPALVNVVRTFTSTLGEPPSQQQACQQAPHSSSSPVPRILPSPKGTTPKSLNVSTPDGSSCCCSRAVHAVDAKPAHGCNSTIRISGGSGGSGSSGDHSSDTAAIKGLPGQATDRHHPSADSARNAVTVLEHLLVTPLMPPRLLPSAVVTAAATAIASEENFHAGGAVNPPTATFDAGYTKTPGPHVVARAAAQAMEANAMEALLPLLRLPSTKGDSASWRALRVLLVLERFSAKEKTERTEEVPSSSGVLVDDGMSGSTGAGKGGAATLSRLGALFAASPALIPELLQSVAALLAVSGALTEDSSGTLLVVLAELLSHGSLQVDQVQKHAPALVEAATGILTGTNPGSSWSALLPCALERNSQRTHGSVRYSAQLEVAAALLAKELLGWALAREEMEGEEEGEDWRGGEKEGSGGWRRGLQVTPLAAALVQRCLDRPGAFKALGEAGMSCLTLGLQLAPPSELWTGKLGRDIPRMVRKVKSMLEHHKYISVWQLALVVAVSTAAGSKLLLHSPATVATVDSTSAAHLLQQQLQCVDKQPSAFQETQPGEQLQQQQQAGEISPQEAAQEFITYLMTCMATVKLSKLSPFERLAIVAGALNAAVACIAPQRLTLHSRSDSARAGNPVVLHRHQELLLPSLAKMQLMLLSPLPQPQPQPQPSPPQPSQLAAQVEGLEEEEKEREAAAARAAAKRSAMDPRAVVYQQPLLRAMSETLERLNCLLAIAIEAGEEDTRQGRARGVRTDAADGVDGSSIRDADSDQDINGSFHGVNVHELAPILAAALRVAANAAAVIREGFCAGCTS
ncbi:hypothetical protein Vafri_22032 [Volvox africanus]|uniref:Uncharacterized protein n=1 Tax=Volvox africanus TaxID=51714 RepID=A0A8J4BVE6_9CHLO|nr:hypothetical protein Vafri_22032 [Volvox africanus]